MALSCKVGSITVAAATGNQGYTGVGFQPKAVIFWGNRLSTDTSSSSSNNADYTFFYGMATDSTHRGVTYQGDNWSACRFGTSTTRCIYDAQSGSATPNYAADFVSMDADGFTVNWVTANATAYVVNYMAFGGSDLTNAIVLNKTNQQTTGNEAWTGAGFQPDFVFLLNGQVTESTSRFFSPMLGAAKSSSARWVTMYGYNGTNDDSFQFTNKALSFLKASTDPGAPDEEGDFVSMDSDGFTVNLTTAINVATQTQRFALCLKGGNYAVGSFSGPTSTGNSAVVSGLGFQPSGVLFASFGRVSSSTIVAAAPMQQTVGAASSSTARGCTVQNEGSSTGAASLDRTKIYKFFGDGNTTVATAADFVSMDSGGFTINVTTADATARQVLYFAVGSTVTAPSFTLVGRTVLDYGAD